MNASRFLLPAVALSLIASPSLAMAKKPASQPVPKHQKVHKEHMHKTSSETKKPL